MSETPHFDTLVDIYEHATKEFSSRELFGTRKEGRWVWTTYAEFRDQVEAMRGGLAELGVGRGDRIVIISDNRVEWAVLAYACFTMGAVFVPMYEAQSEKDWKFIVKDCEGKILVAATKSILEKTKAFLTEIPSLQHIVVIESVSGAGSSVSSFASRVDHGRAKKVASIKAEPKDLACFIYTSGTTGDPKGVELSHGNFASNITAVHKIFPMEKDDRALSFLPWAHSFGQTCELHCLMSMGASMALVDNVSKLLEYLPEVKPTLLFSVPRIFNKLYAGIQKKVSERPEVLQNLVKTALKLTAKEREGKRLTVSEHLKLTLADRLVFSKARELLGGRLKYAFSGGAKIAVEVAEFIDSLGIMVYEGYGLTETSPISTANCPGARKIGSVGRAIPGVTIEIDPTAGHGGKGRVEGEIIVHGPNVMIGYHHREKENAEAFTKDHGFRTGDQGFLDPHGFLFITGRIKEQYKLENGKYVVPTPLEEQLKLSPFVLNAFVYGDNRPYNVALLVANVEAVKKWASGQGLSIPEAQLLEHPKVRELFKGEVTKYGEAFKGFEEIKDFTLVKEDFTTDNGMLTPSLKVKRRTVMEVYGKQIDGLYTKRAEKSSQAAASA
jgi:long-chain acyl-CoA synthetase